MDLLRHKNYSQAYFVYTSKGFREKTSLSDFIKFVDKAPVLAGNRAPEVTRLVVDGDKDVDWCCDV